MIILFILVKLEVLVVVGVGVVLTVGGSDGDDYIQYLVTIRHYSSRCRLPRPDFPKGIYEKEQDLLLYSSKIVLVNNYYKNDIPYPRMMYKKL